MAIEKVAKSANQSLHADTRGCAFAPPPVSFWLCLSKEHCESCTTKGRIIAAAGKFQKCRRLTGFQRKKNEN